MKKEYTRPKMHVLLIESQHIATGSVKFGIDNNTASDIHHHHQKDIDDTCEWDL